MHFASKGKIKNKGRELLGAWGAEDPAKDKRGDPTPCKKATIEHEV